MSNRQTKVSLQSLDVKNRKVEEESAHKKCVESHSVMSYTNYVEIIPRPKIRSDNFRFEDRRFWIDIPKN